MSAFGKVFEKLKAEGTGALIAYIMAGDPSLDVTTSIADALICGGTDILELGVPFSDPIADGPSIQAASVRALNAGTTPREVFRTVKEIKENQVIIDFQSPAEAIRPGLSAQVRIKLT